MTIDTTECRFKLALMMQKYSDVLRILKGTSFPGSSLVAYLEKKNFPEVAMHFVTDPSIRFNLAVECGELDVAKECISKMSGKEDSDEVQQAWKTLGAAAIACGNLELAEKALTMTKQFDKLRFLLLITGQLERLHDSVGTGGASGLGGVEDTSNYMQYALLLGDAALQIKLLTRAGQFPLALSVALQHNMEDLLEDLTEKFQDSHKRWLAEQKTEEELAAENADEELAAEAAQYVDEVLQRVRAGGATPGGSSLAPPQPQCLPSNWPLLPPPETIFTRGLKKSVGAFEEEEDEEGEVGGWEEPSDEEGEGEKKEKDPWESEGGSDMGGGDGWVDDDDQIPLEPDAVGDAQGGAGAGGYVVPREGRSAAKQWVLDSPLPPDHIAAGDFDGALGLLKKQCGVHQPNPLKIPALAIATAAMAFVPSLPLVPSRVLYLNREPEAAAKEQASLLASQELPATALNLSRLQTRLQGVYKAFRTGAFAEALTQATLLLQSVCLCTVPSKDQLAELRALQTLTREYVGTLVTQLELKEVSKAEGKSKAQVKHQLELAAYCASFGLQVNAHVLLTTRQAMTHAYKAKCYGLAGIFARKLLELNPEAQDQARAKQAVNKAESEGEDPIKIDYDARNPFEVDCISWQPIYRGQEGVRCAYCCACYLPANRGKTCVLCGVGEIGRASAGMMNSFAQQ
eukprot:NODE_342_length_2207_cov_29.053290_g270_i0.p1 GENE.NODE_342_length_2207_cov_29.053290_g270_i0~~NODE_342_length_2207_cov_29.053290_g270_i0.p1  ORF type:complete len:708 (+),score=252.75 NODE_342_length_2207_cov_29.053290_g270_i0:68-2125(+)